MCLERMDRRLSVSEQWSVGHAGTRVSFMPNIGDVSGLSWGTSPSGQTKPKRRSLSKIFRRPHSTYQKVVQGKCPLNFLRFNGAICSNTLFSNTSALTNALLFRANLHAKVLEHLVWSLLGSNFGGRLLEHIFCRHFAAFPDLSFS